MIKIEIKDGMNLERALKELKRKFTKHGVVKELRERREFTKPSVKRRDVVKRAKYKEAFLRKEE